MLIWHITAMVALCHPHKPQESSMIAYKLTDRHMRTHGGFQWTLGETQRTDGEGALCGSGWLHFYLHPLLAVLLNPIHANITQPRLFEATATGRVKHDRGVKAGTTELTLVREIPLPEVTTAQRVRFAENCAAYAKSRVGQPRQSPEEIAHALVQCGQEVVS